LILFLHLRSVEVELAELVCLHTIRVLKVIKEIDQKVRKDLISNIGTVVQAHIQISEHYQIFLVVLAGQSTESGKKLRTRGANWIAGVEIHYLDG
jgi:hypothetical protein